MSFVAEVDILLFIHESRHEKFLAPAVRQALVAVAELYLKEPVKRAVLGWDLNWNVLQMV